MLTLGVKPSSLPEAYWSHSIKDLKTLVRLKMEYELAKANQDLENLIYTASKIFGGSEKKTKPVESIDEALSTLARMGIG